MTVRVGECEDLRARRLDDLHDCSGFPATREIEHTYARRLETTGDRDGGIFRSVGGDPNPQAIGRVVERQGVLDTRLDRVLFVMGRDDQIDFGRVLRRVNRRGGKSRADPKKKRIRKERNCNRD